MICCVKIMAFLYYFPISSLVRRFKSFFALSRSAKVPVATQSGLVSLVATRCIFFFHSAPWIVAIGNLKMFNHARTNEDSSLLALQNLNSQLANKWYPSAFPMATPLPPKGLFKRLTSTRRSQSKAQIHWASRTFTVISSFFGFSFRNLSCSAPNKPKPMKIWCKKRRPKYQDNT